MVENSLKKNLDDIRRKGVPNQTFYTTRIQLSIERISKLKNKYCSNRKC